MRVGEIRDERDSFLKYGDRVLRPGGRDQRVAKVAERNGDVPVIADLSIGGYRLGEPVGGLVLLLVAYKNRTPSGNLKVSSTVPLT